MGLYNKGILGPFSGKVGTVIGTSWRGKYIMRSLPKIVFRNPTDLQALQRQKFSFVSAFLNGINVVINLYFGTNEAELTRMNQAMSYHLKNAVSYVAPNFSMLYNRVLISKGDLLGFQNQFISAPSSNNIRFTWDNNSGQGQAQDTDVLVVVFFEPIGGTFFYTLNAADRSAGTTTIAVPTDYNGLSLESWITFASADNKRYATSVYMGSITVT